MSSSTGRFVVATRTGAAAELHGDGLLGDGGDPRPRAWWLEAERSALVLGSAQPISHVDIDACVERSIEVVRRRSGGGAVLVVPDEMVWLDVVVAVGDPLWHDDVGRSMWWLGEVWAEAIHACGLSGAEVHRGPMRTSPWSRLVCFDGVGAGEVTVGGAKVVGISQRRTRTWARLQSAAHLVWRGDEMVQLLAPPRPDVGDLAAPVVVPAAVAELRTALVGILATR